MPLNTILMEMTSKLFKRVAESRSKLVLEFTSQYNLTQFIDYEALESTPEAIF